MADVMNTPLDQRTVSTLLGAILQQRLQQQDPLRRTQVQAAQQELAEKQRQAEAFRAIQEVQLAQPEAPRPQGIPMPGGGYYQGVEQIRPPQYEGDTSSWNAVVAPEPQPQQPRAIGNVGQLAALIQGLKGVPGDTAQRLIAQLTGIDPTQATLSKEKELATFKHGLGAGEREQKQQLNEAKLQALVERYQQLAQQGQMTQMLGQQRQALAEQTEGRRAQTAAMPSMPPKQAQAIIESMAQSGAGPEQLAAAAQAMGYDVGSGQSYEKGLLFPTQVPVLGRRGVSGGAVLPKGRMRIRNPQTGETAIGPEGKVPSGWERIN